MPIIWLLLLFCASFWSGYRMQEALYRKNEAAFIMWAIATAFSLFGTMYWAIKVWG